MLLLVEDRLRGALLVVILELAILISPAFTVVALAVLIFVMLLELIFTFELMAGKFAHAAADPPAPVVILAPFQVRATPSGLVREPYGAKPELLMATDAARVIAVLAISTPPCAVMAPELVTVPADTNPEAVTVVVLTSPTAKGGLGSVEKLLAIIPPCDDIPPVLNNDPF